MTLANPFPLSFHKWPVSVSGNNVSDVCGHLRHKKYFARDYVVRVWI